jgi:hypothetical protein
LSYRVPEKPGMTPTLADSDIAARMNRDAILAELLEIEGHASSINVSATRTATPCTGQRRRYATSWTPRHGNRPRRRSIAWVTAPARRARRWCTEGSTMTTIHIFKHQLRRP